MSESKFNTTQYQNVIGGGTEKWINMSDSERKELRKGIATNLNIGLTLSPFGGGAAGAMNLAKVMATSLKNPRNAISAVKGLLSSVKNYFSSYALGENASKAIFEAREKLAKLINASPHELVFTSSGTEAISTAILGIAELKNKKNQNCCLLVRV